MPPKLRGLLCWFLLGRGLTLTLSLCFLIAKKGSLQSLLRAAGRLKLAVYMLCTWHTRAPCAMLWACSCEGLGWDVWAKGGRTEGS